MRTLTKLPLTSVLTASIAGIFLPALAEDKALTPGQGVEIISDGPEELRNQLKSGITSDISITDTAVSNIASAAEDPCNEILKGLVKATVEASEITPAGTVSVSGDNVDRTYANAGKEWGTPLTNANKAKDPYVLDNEADSITGKDVIYLQHIGDTGSDAKEIHGAAIHVEDYVDDKGDLELSASGNIRIDAVYSSYNKYMYDGIQAYDERNVNVTSAGGDVFIYANNKGIDADDTKEKTKNGGKVTIKSLNGCNVIQGGVHRKTSAPEGGDGIRNQGTGSIAVYAAETNSITGRDVGIFVHSDSTKTISKRY